MDTNKFFSFSRIAMVMKREIMENWKTNLYRPPPALLWMSTRTAILTLLRELFARFLQHFELTHNLHTFPVIRRNKTKRDENNRADNTIIFF